MRFRVIVLLLSLTFVATSGFAASPRSAARPAPPRSAWVDMLAQSFRGFLWSFWSADGCFLDPLGRCAAKQTVDSGCFLDPLGRCAPQPKADDGCRIDPLGRCIQAQPTTDSGCFIDPLGRCK